VSLRRPPAIIVAGADKAVMDPIRQVQRRRQGRPDTWR
jgi:hypothetical protein